MNTAPEIRLHLLFATENASAVILLRKARRLYRLIQWNRDTDTFTDGQWLKKEMYPDACALSPDGKHFLFTVVSRHPDAAAFPSYTAISTPPYFTAHMLFPNTYGYGPTFLGNDLVSLRDTQARDVFGTYKIVRQAIQGRISKECKTGLRLPNDEPVPLSRELRQQLLGKGDAKQGLNPLDRYDTTDGRLSHINGDGSLNFIRDFRGMEFEYIKAPYTSPTPPEAANTWHPLNGDHP